MINQFKFESIDLAELIGIILGDGSFYINNGQYQFDIAFNSTENHIFFVRKLLENSTKAYIYEKSERKKLCKHLRICQKPAVLELLSKTTKKAGDKITNQVTIPKWILKNKKFLKACVRGLIDTDGSVYRLKPHWPNLFQISFKNNNKVLLRDTREAFVKLGYNPSKVFGNRFVLTRQQEIIKYFKDIGTHNPKVDSPLV